MTTKSIIHVGIALFLLGGATLTYQGVSYRTPEKIVDADHPQARGDTAPLSPLLGGLLLGGGILLIAVGVKKSPRSQ